MTKIKNKIYAILIFMISYIKSLFENLRHPVANEKGDYVDTAVKILIGCVIGALILYGLYALFGDTVMPTLKQKIQDMFGYSG